MPKNDQSDRPSGRDAQTTKASDPKVSDATNPPEDAAEGQTADNTTIGSTASPSPVSEPDKDQQNAAKKAEALTAKANELGAQLADIQRQANQAKLAARAARKEALNPPLEEGGELGGEKLVVCELRNRVTPRHFGRSFGPGKRVVVPESVAIAMGHGYTPKYEPPREDDSRAGARGARKK